MPGYPRRLLCFVGRNYGQEIRASGFQYIGSDEDENPFFKPPAAVINAFAVYSLHKRRPRGQPDIYREGLFRAILNLHYDRINHHLDQ
jgi:hypothetical protein